MNNITSKAIIAISKLVPNSEVKSCEGGKFRATYSIPHGMKASVNFEVRSGKLYRVGLGGYSDSLVTTL